MLGGIAEEGVEDRGGKEALRAEVEVAVVVAAGVDFMGEGGVKSREGRIEGARWTGHRR